MVRYAPSGGCTPSSRMQYCLFIFSLLLWYTLCCTFDKIHISKSMHRTTCTNMSLVWVNKLNCTGRDRYTIGYKVSDLNLNSLLSLSVQFWPRRHQLSTVFSLNSLLNWENSQITAEYILSWVTFLYSILYWVCTQPHFSNDTNGFMKCTKYTKWNVHIRPRRHQI